jgi:hypothetical protein
MRHPSTEGNFWSKNVKWQQILSAAGWIFVGRWSRIYIEYATLFKPCMDIEGIIFMKKKPVIAGIIILAVIAAAAVYFSQPKNIIDDINRYSIHRVVYNGVDVTERVDCVALASLVSKYQCSRLPRSSTLYHQSQVVVELNGMNGDDPLHILLGDINYAYESGDKGSFSIINSGALLNEILKIMPYLTAEELGLKEKKVITFSDGESADLWRPDYSNRDIYKLSDGTVLLTVQDTVGPGNVYVGGVESFDDLSDAAKKAVSAFYEKQGLLYDTRSELKNAYAEYLACKESGTEYHERHITQDIAPTASNDTIMCFQTSVILPTKGDEVQELRLGASFDRNTGKALGNWDLFALPEAEARQRLLDAFDVEPALRAEMEAALKPEYITLFPESLSVTFPQGTLPSQEHAYGFGLKYNKLKDVLHPWAIPNSPA